MNDNLIPSTPFAAPAVADHERRILRTRRSLRIISPALAALLFLPMAAQASSDPPDPTTTTTTQVTTATASSGLSAKVYTVFNAVAGDTRATSGTAEASTNVLTIKVNDVRSFYGDYPKSYTVTVEGLKGTDTAASVTQGLRISGPNPAADVGEYPIRPYGATIPAGYSVQYVNGSHAIIPAPLQVRVGDRVTRYGQVPSFDVGYYGLRNGDTAPATVHALRVVPDGAPRFDEPVEASASTSAGSYDVYPEVFDPNYEIYPVAGNWTVDKAPLDVTADSVTITWGDPHPDYQTHVRGLVNGDTTSDLTTIGVIGTIRARPDVGTYRLTMSGGTSPNYETHYGAGSLRVLPRHVTVSVDNLTRTYGSPNPPLTATVTGMPPGVELETRFDPVPRDLGVGTWKIRFQRPDDPNLDIEIRGGTLTTVAAPLTVMPPMRKIASGAAVGDPVPQLSGWVYDDTDADLRSKPTCTAAVGGAPVSATTKPGIYHDAISCAGGEAPAGYALVYRTSPLWINPTVTLQATGLPTGLTVQATVDGASVTLPRTAVEVEYGTTHSYQFERTVIDSRGRVFITTAAPFSGSVIDNANVTAAYTTMGRLLSNAVEAGHLDEPGGRTLADLWFPTERDVVADYQHGALQGLREFAASVRSLPASRISAEVSANLLAHAQVVFAFAGGEGAL